MIFWNARARNTHVEAKLNHPCAAQAALRKLDLARNAVDADCAVSLARLFRDAHAAPYLREVVLNWTNLRTTAGNTICKGLGKSRVHTADLSWNAWYSDPTTGDDAAVQGVAWMLRRSSSLTHLDLSHGRMAPGDVEVVAKALARNRAELESSTRLQCDHTRRFERTVFCRASRTQEEQSIRPETSRIDVDLTERDSSEVWWGPPEPAVGFGAGAEPRGHGPPHAGQRRVLRRPRLPRGAVRGPGDDGRALRGPRLLADFARGLAAAGARPRVARCVEIKSSTRLQCARIRMV